MCFGPSKVSIRSELQIAEEFEGSLGKKKKTSVQWKSGKIQVFIYTYDSFSQFYYIRPGRSRRANCWAGRKQIETEFICGFFFCVCCLLVCYIVFECWENIFHGLGDTARKLHTCRNPVADFDKSLGYNLPLPQRDCRLFLYIIKLKN